MWFNAYNIIIELTSKTVNLTIDNSYISFLKVRKYTMSRCLVIINPVSGGGAATPVCPRLTMEIEYLIRND